MKASAISSEIIFQMPLAAVYIPGLGIYLPAQTAKVGFPPVLFSTALFLLEHQG